MPVRLVMEWDGPAPRRGYTEAEIARLEYAMSACLADAVALATRPPSEGGAPRDTGRLAASITFRVLRQGNELRGVFGVFDAAVHYAIYQELGTRYIKPKLFLRNAFDRTARRLLQYMR